LFRKPAYSDNLRVCRIIIRFGKIRLNNKKFAIIKKSDVSFVVPHSQFTRNTDLFSNNLYLDTPVPILYLESEPKSILTSQELTSPFTFTKGSMITPGFSGTYEVAHKGLKLTSSDSSISSVVALSSGFLPREAIIGPNGFYHKQQILKLSFTIMSDL
jgi:hypothetical protein